MVVNVVAKMLHLFGYEGLLWRLVSAAANFDWGIPPRPCQGMQAIKSRFVQL